MAASRRTSGGSVRLCILLFYDLPGGRRAASASLTTSLYDAMPSLQSALHHALYCLSLQQKMTDEVGMRYAVPACSLGFL